MNNNVILKAKTRLMTASNNNLSTLLFGDEICPLTATLIIQCKDWILT